ncbi:RTA1 domain containing protein [Fusarium agapanthi]|uniref:RTA1 domain containing protein n=1 Tax=Fusarium agapanthi TaxID=1803897 RepID=A0A9P5E7W8_9HYPO|nr:RTA1 domain containing protein [Fusarium agapanthi]
MASTEQADHLFISTTPSKSLSTPSSVEVVSSSQSISTTTFSIHEMCLLHHWTTSTSLSIFATSDVSVCWQIVFPQISFKHPFVMHAILSLAALHLAYLYRSNKHQHIVEATRYHTKALQGFHEAINHTGSENSDALFAWSILNLLYVFGIFGQLGEDVEIEPEPLYSSRTDRMLGVEWIPMIRGVEAVLRPSQRNQEFSRLSHLRNPGNWYDLDPDKNLDSLDECFRQIRSSWEQSVDAPTYDEALWVLRKCRMFVAQFDTMDVETLKDWEFNREWSGPLMFIFFAPREYFTFLKQRQPPALVLFAFFGGLLHTLNYCWLLEGWGKGIVEVIDDLLGSYWRPLIAWPAKVVGLC